ncbi:MAG: ribosome recycling factor [Clostridia bacterium]|nr:ribosome recycling factor [Clostridia bacterium]
MPEKVVELAVEKMEKTAAMFKKELGALRAGRANPQLLDRISVDYYGTPTPLSQVANISAPEARQLVIALYDSSMISAVEKEIQKSDLGMTPSNDGKIIRLIVPELNEERRRELTKVVRKSCEDAKVAVRAVRRDANEQIKKMEKASDITEDDQKSLEKDIQKAHDDAIKELDRIAAEKEKEIMSV